MKSAKNSKIEKAIKRLEVVKKKLEDRLDKTELIARKHNLFD
jgi:hypothetical protein